MFVLALVLFGIGAAGGSLLAYLRMHDKPLPLPLALAHGALGAAGIVALLLGVLGGSRGSATIALVLFLVAALGGFFLFAQHLKKRPLPMGVIVVHGLVAVSAFVVLLLGVVG